MSINNKVILGTSFDAVLLTFIKLISTVLGLIVTRLLSEYLSVLEYGTYSQILLVVSTSASITIFGMMDGINYFYCREKDEQKRESYTATVLSLQCIVGTVAGCIIMLMSTPLCIYFDNPDVKRLMIFAAMFPVLQNIMGMLQVLLVSVGRARTLAIRNFVVAVVRLIIVLVVVFFVHSVAVVLATTAILDVCQIIFFGYILRKNRCYISFTKLDVHLLREIVSYCAPLAVFAILNTLNRNMDKYLISMVTNTETMAVYSNASKQLPFDIFMASFCTVLIPHITRLVSQKDSTGATKLYRCFLEIAYITTGILCCAALSVAPQLMKLLYSNKYMSGLDVFCIYIFVDLLRFTNITLVLTAANKTKLLMVMGFASMILNAVLNVLFYKGMGIIGPAVATLSVTIILGIAMLCCNARVLETRFSRIFDLRYLAVFILESLVLTVILGLLREYMDSIHVHYFVIILIVAGIYGILMLLLNGKRLLSDMKLVDSISRRY